jgi:hypothetical protein
VVSAGSQAQKAADYILTRGTAEIEVDLKEGNETEAFYSKATQGFRERPALSLQIPSAAEASQRLLS